jgi:transposase
MSGKRRKYTPEFREQAARLVIETGRPVAHVAAEVGVGEQLLGRWVRLAKESAAAIDTGAVLDADERAELERLRRENAELRLDRAFLKIAAASSSPNTTGSGLPGDRGGEGQLHGVTDVRAAGGVTLRFLQIADASRSRPHPDAATTYRARRPGRGLARGI